MGILNIDSVAQAVFTLLSEKKIKGLVNNKKYMYLWKSMVTSRFADRLIDHYTKSKEFFEDPTGDPPFWLSGNGSVWHCLHKCYELMSENSNCPVEYKMAVAAKHLVSSRTKFTPRHFEEWVSHMTNSEKMALHLLNMREQLHEAYKQARDDFYKKLVEAKSLPTERPIETEQYDKKNLFNITILWDLVIIEEKEGFHCMLREHVKRLTDCMTASVTLLMCHGQLEPYKDAYWLNKRLLIDISEVGLEHPEAVGEYIKAARNMHVSKMSDVLFEGKQLSTYMLAEYDTVKQTQCKKIYDALSSYSKYPEVLLNLTCLYKIVPHPDANLQDCFNKIRGLLEPNQVDNASLEKFPGMVRKSLALSLKEMNYDVRCLPLNESESAEKVCKALNGTQYNKNVLQGMSSENFKHVIFEKVDRLSHFMDNQLNIQSKSSAKHTSIPGEYDKKYSRKEYVTNKQNHEKMDTVNDIETHIKGEDQLDIKEAFKTFSDIRKQHEELEKDYKCPEDIPQDVMENFMRFRCKYPYTVLTEPKLGEKHKKVTRLFYMGEQKLKAITQTVERLVKNITKRQPGVTITKSYQSRVKDLQIMSSYMRVRDDKTMPLFISFDMSSFSMKFPMSLVRVYGKVLSELTGNEDLKRLDLIFRNSVVHHDTRGYYDYIIAPKGGFEGFFNFLWSSIHAMIMDEAQRIAGVTGHLMTYSDDGLLYLQVSHDPFETDFILKKIKEVYRSFGLEFNVGKTLIGTVVWEYLGNICYDGRIIDTYIKELCSLGCYEESEGLNTFGMKIMSLVGQYSAAIHAGANPPVIELITLIYGMYNILRMVNTVDTDKMLLMLITPFSLSGYRIPSWESLLISSQIEGEQEFITDLKLLIRNHYPGSSVLASWLGSTVSDWDGDIHRLFSFNRIVSSNKDTSGRGIYTALAKEIYQQWKGKKMPPLVDEKQEKEILQVLKSMDSVNMNVVTSVMKLLPQWIELQNLVKYAKSRGAIRILSRDIIRTYQSQDSRSIRASILGFIEKLETTPHSEYYIRLLFESAKGGSFKELKLANPKYTFRESFDVTTKDYDLLATSSIIDGKHVESLVFPEPVFRVARKPDLASYYAELPGETTQRDINKLMAYLGTIVATYPNGYNSCLAIVGIMGIYVPYVSPHVSNSANLIKTITKNKPEITHMGKKIYRSLVSVDHKGTFLSLINSDLKFDKSTYTESLRALTGACSCGIYYCQLQKTPYQLPVKFDYNLSDTLLAPEHIDSKMTLILKESIFNKCLSNISKLILPRYAKEFKDKSLIRTVNDKQRIFSDHKYLDAADAFERSALEELEYTKRVMQEDEKNISIITADDSIAICALVELRSKWLYIYLKRIFSSPTQQFDLTSLPPMVSKLIGKKVLYNTIYKFLTSDEQANNIISGYATRDDYKMSLDSQEHILSLLEYMQAELSLLKYSDDQPVYNQNELFEVFSNLDTIMSECAQLRYNLSPFYLMNRSVIAIDYTKETGNYLTNAYIRAIKSGIQNTSSHILRMGQACKWNEAEMASRLSVKSMKEVDYLVDYCSIVASILRFSSHRARSHPYNDITFMVECFKHILFLKSLYHLAMSIKHNTTNSLIDQLTGENGKMDKKRVSSYFQRFLKDWRLSQEQKSMAIRQFMRYQSSDRTHIDHKAKLDEPLVNQYRNSYYIIEAIRFVMGERNNFQNTMLNYDIQASDWSSSQLSRDINRIGVERVLTPLSKKIVIIGNRTLEEMSDNLQIKGIDINASLSCFQQYYKPLNLSNDEIGVFEIDVLASIVKEARHNGDILEVSNLNDLDVELVEKLITYKVVNLNKASNNRFLNTSNETNMPQFFILETKDFKEALAMLNKILSENEKTYAKVCTISDEIYKIIVVKTESKRNFSKYVRKEMTKQIRKAHFERKDRQILATYATIRNITHIESKDDNDLDQDELDLVDDSDEPSINLIKDVVIVRPFDSLTQELLSNNNNPHAPSRNIMMVRGNDNVYNSLRMPNYVDLSEHPYLSIVINTFNGYETYSQMESLYRYYIMWITNGDLSEVHRINHDLSDVENRMHPYVMQAYRQDIRALYTWLSCGHFKDKAKIYHVAGSNDKAFSFKVLSSEEKVAISLPGIPITNLDEILRGVSVGMDYANRLFKEADKRMIAIAANIGRFNSTRLSQLDREALATTLRPTLSGNTIKTIKADNSDNDNDDYKSDDDNDDNFY